MGLWGGDRHRDACMQDWLKPDGTFLVGESKCPYAYGCVYVDVGQGADATMGVVCEQTASLARSSRMHLSSRCVILVLCPPTLQSPLKMHSS